jgi:hypothetical protein
MVRFISVPVPAGRMCMPCAMRFALAAASLLATLTAQAQPADQTARPDPLDANASVPALSYESSLSQYRRLGDEKPVSWRDANDTVTRIGGWRVYAREAQQPDPAPAAKPANATPAAPPREPPREPGMTPPAKPLPAGHGGHRMP